MISASIFFKIVLSYELYGYWQTLVKGTELLLSAILKTLVSNLADIIDNALADKKA